jgi:hypothetical protein
MQPVLSGEMPMRIALSVLIALPAAVPAQAIDYHGIFNDGVYRRVDPPIVNEEELKAYEALRAPSRS